MSSSRIKKGDIVIAGSGSDAGKTGKVLEVLVGKGRVVVEGLRMMKKHMKKSTDHPKGAIVEREGTFAISVLMPYCEHCKKGAKVKRVKEGDSSVRKCRKCGHPFNG